MSATTALTDSPLEYSAMIVVYLYSYEPTLLAAVRKQIQHQGYDTLLVTWFHRHRMCCPPTTRLSHPPSQSTYYSRYVIYLNYRMAVFSTANPSVLCWQDARLTFNNEPDASTPTSRRAEASLFVVAYIMQFHYERVTIRVAGTGEVLPRR